VTAGGRSLDTLPNLLVIGAMKCGTSAVHGLLDRHPDVAMAPGKELNFFIGSDQPVGEDPGEWWRHGQWHRGLRWYADQFDAGAPVRGETSPAYTDPSHPDAAARVRAVLPHVRLVYLVRDPFERAVSQWRHHVRDGTEPRSVADALLDPGSQYVARSRYAERVEPYLARFQREQLLVVVQERLRTDPDDEVCRIVLHAGAAPERWPAAQHGAERGTDPAVVPAGLREAFWERVSDDVVRLRELVGDAIPEWRTPSGARLGRRG
jgi:Sulfotransferase family